MGSHLCPVHDQRPLVMLPRCSVPKEAHIPFCLSFLLSGLPAFVLGYDYMMPPSTLSILRRAGKSITPHSSMSQGSGFTHHVRHACILYVTS